MDRRKRRTGSDEGLALVKAAAWAWYQRGVGDEGMPAREVHTPKPLREPRPSRFKLEAAAAAGSGGVGGASDLPRSSRPERGPSERRHDKGENGSQRSRGAMIGGEANRRKTATKVNGFWMKHAVGICGPPADVVQVGALRPPQPRPGKGKSLTGGADDGGPRVLRQAARAGEL
ncbi:unnamed protein product [Spirodela intermedia]|uniref:Uncharacterized protein n=1 Tax=Spirodela intermedia TaxID=51605 RepID=A0A7I8KV21_SPIIN|nr:unnamed protein product [Spirodela intermedia]